MTKKTKETTGQISVRFPPELVAGIESICANEDRKAANVVKVLVKEALIARRLLSGNPAQSTKPTDPV